MDHAEYVATLTKTDDDPVPQPGGVEPPWVREHAAIWDDRPDPLLIGTMVRWRCPHCGAHLCDPNGDAREVERRGRRFICLNTCHLTPAQTGRFNDLMRSIAYEIKERG
jgi:hypothetical protein